MRMNFAGPNPEIIMTMDELIVFVKHNSDMAQRVYPKTLSLIPFDSQGATLEETPQGYKLLHLPIKLTGTFTIKQ